MVALVCVVCVAVRATSWCVTWCVARCRSVGMTLRMALCMALCIRQMRLVRAVRPVRGRRRGAMPGAAHTARSLQCMRRVRSAWRVRSTFGGFGLGPTCCHGAQPGLLHALGEA